MVQKSKFHHLLGKWLICAHRNDKKAVPNALKSIWDSHFLYYSDRSSVRSLNFATDHATESFSIRFTSGTTEF